MRSGAHSHTTEKFGSALTAHLFSPVVKLLLSLKTSCCHLTANHNNVDLIVRGELLDRQHLPSPSPRRPHGSFTSTSPHLTIRRWRTRVARSMTTMTTTTTTTTNDPTTRATTQQRRQATSTSEATGVRRHRMAKQKLYRFICHTDTGAPASTHTTNKHTNTRARAHSRDFVVAASVARRRLLQ